jgi:heat shock protein HslJ
MGSRDRQERAGVAHGSVGGSNDGDGDRPGGRGRGSARRQVADRRGQGAGPFDASKTLFEVAADGRVSSTIGRNHIVGEPSVAGETIAFAPMTATRMACPPPLDQLETRTLAARARVRSWRIESGALIFADGRGDRILALRRAD